MAVQEALLNSPIANHWDIIVIQEPYLNFLCNTRANHKWHVLYPTQHYTHPQKRSRAITLINAKLDTNSWSQIEFPSSDVVALQVISNIGKYVIFNIYNACENQDTITALNTFLEENSATIRPTDNDQMIWMGDFNRHHPLWEDIRNRHLFNYNTSQPLIDTIADYGMIQLLPQGTPTLQSLSTGNWTCPDNVFGTERILDTIISCKTAPEARGPKTDHIPIQLILDTSVPTTPEEPRRNWKDIEWDEFNKTLSNLLSLHPPAPLATNDEFQFMAGFLTRSITETIEKHVPRSKPCPHSKRWWAHELSKLRKKVMKMHHQAYQMRGLPQHEIHEELK
jgi:exonuclease III